MARQTAVSAENNFVKGLITESVALNFPENACTETFDCIFSTTGRVTRRLGFDFEDNHVKATVTAAAGDAVTEFAWTNVGGSGTTSFFVVQRGATLHFYDNSINSDLSANKKDFTVDLADFLPTGSSNDPAQSPCQYAISDGDLIVVNPSCDIFSLEYLVASDTLESTAITLQIRDFEGVDDGLTLIERPAFNVSGLISNNPAHYYNLLNQGWYIADALSQWGTARSDMPSNADQVPFYRGSETDAFDNQRVGAKSPGFSPAPNGHFIIDVTNIDRPQAIVDSGQTGIGTVTSHTQISRTLGTRIGNMTGFGGMAASFDGNFNQSGNVSSMLNTTSGYIGKNFGSTFRITRAFVSGPNDGGYSNGPPTTITLQLRAKNGSAPTSESDGTLLGSIAFTDLANESGLRQITSSNTTTFWQYVWIRLTGGTGGGALIAISEIRFDTVGSVSTPGGLEPFVTLERPSTVAHLNGRLFYAGIDNSLIGNNVYFSQIIQRPEQRGKCHQQNDPTSEQNATLLPDDGGVIRIPEMGVVKKLFSARSAMLVFATNGVWLISGSQGQGFLATDYSVSRITSIGTDSGLSFVDYNGMPIWWGEDGIYTLKYSAEYNSYEAVQLTLKSIKSFYLDIPTLNRSFVKGTYDSYANVLYWVYNDTEDLASTDHYTYNKVLCYNGATDAFYPWTIGDSDPIVQGVYYLQDTARNFRTFVKYTTTIPVDDTSVQLTFSETINPLYTDWLTYSVEQNDSSLAQDYSSHFITGYKIAGAGQRFFQANYAFLFLEQEENAGAYLQGVYDFTNSGNSGRWSSKQQVYNQMLLNRDVNYRRLKIRGRGRSLQLRVTSEPMKPFTIIGWSLWETLNSEL